MTSTTNTETGIFQNYWRKVRQQFGLSMEVNNLRNITKTDALLSILPNLGKLNIGALFEALEHGGWKGRSEDEQQREGKQKYGSNWIWRNCESTDEQPEDQSFCDDDDEVKLERAIAKTNDLVWSYQMSTASGVNDERGRRAIDLVRFNGDESFTFIELKIAADNPVFAAFEILGYTLAYLHARSKKWPSRELGAHNVMNAKHIELAVLGHDEKFYKQFSQDWNDHQSRLEELIENQLNQLLVAGPLASEINNLQFEFRFRSFSKQFREERKIEIIDGWTNHQRA